MKIIAAVIGVLISFYLICFADMTSANQNKSLKGLINRLNNNYSSINKSLKELEDRIERFPRTTLTMSVVKKLKNKNILSIEIWEKKNLLQNHIYSPFENRILAAGSRHQLYKDEIKTGYHVLTVTYYFEGEDNKIAKGRTNIKLYIKTGNNYLMEFTLERKKSKVRLRHTLYVYKET